MIKLQVPGSKSITNRALIAAALADGKNTLKNCLESDDVLHMKRALGILGIKIKKSGKDLRVDGGKFHRTHKILCGNAGTAMRFLAAVLAAQPFESILYGDERMNKRPIGDLIDGLLQLGAQAKSLNKDNCPPIRVKGPIKGGVCKIRGNVSGQFLSGLLLAAPLAQKDVRIQIIGDLVSKPYVDMTIKVMASFGVCVEQNGYKEFRVRAGQKYRPQTFAIEGDASAATYFWGISALTGEKIEITNVPKDTIQADAVTKSKMLNCHPELAAPRPAVVSGSTDWHDVKVNCSDFPDGAMTLAMFCAFMKGKTELTGLANLRVKECDRLHALATELNKIGCQVKEKSDGLIINGNPEKLHGAEIETYNDHRMAMCFGMASFVLPGIKIKNPGCVSKTYPNFWKDLRNLKKRFLERNIILTGMRGCGKTRIGKLVAKKLGRRFIDIDKYIEEKVKMTVREIVAQKGWRSFRKLEMQAAKKLGVMKNLVISTGGGTLMFASNACALKRNGKVILLDCSIPVIKKRLINQTDRPSLTGTKSFIVELEEIYNKRESQYKKVADAVIDVSLQTKNKEHDLEEKSDRIIAQAYRFGLV
ncbi:3-phosphoshikimate 1-carboxyvinyltransferase [Candidatus Peregrinibacteria bacterium]|nr:3-phosphoshikimate 1-carboxyvinyltransferase [Candidatus Peregrinibacteria bacterium]